MTSHEAKTVTDFLLSTPLYTECELEISSLIQLYGHGKIDGYCPECKKETTFNIKPQQIPNGDPRREFIDGDRYEFDKMHLECSRNDEHLIRFYILIAGKTVKKIGQFPSLADISIDEMKVKFRTVLKGDNWTELYNAVGLAAHGEGIGSFVYLRRVFENLIMQRFNQYKESEGWDEKEFQALRMNDRVNFLKDHLPKYLVDNSKIYSIFSKGIHELSNDACLKFFNLGKESILIILEDDLKTQENLNRREKFKKEIASFSGEEVA